MEEALKNWQHGGGTVGTSAQMLSELGFIAEKGVMVCADADNTGPLYIGSNANVTADRSANGGIELNPGSSKGIDINNVSKIWIIGTTPGEGYSFGVF